jgi:hypothetical protein
MKGSQPIIMALARGLMDKMEPGIRQAVEQERLLIITPFEKQVIRVTEETAYIRNKMMIELADSITLGHATEGGKLDLLLKETGEKVIHI